ncbi:MAG: type II secretion system protein [bacterium]
MKRKAGFLGRRGFTLVELVMIIVMLGTLAVVAIPRFIDMQLEAKVATLKGILGSFYTAQGNIIGIFDGEMMFAAQPIFTACGEPGDGVPSDEWLTCLAKYMMNGEIPPNPFTGVNSLLIKWDTELAPCATADPTGGWIWNLGSQEEAEEGPPDNMKWWANSATATLAEGYTEACVQPGGW